MLGLVKEPCWLIIEKLLAFLSRVYYVITIGSWESIFVKPILMFDVAEGITLDKYLSLREIPIQVNYLASVPISLALNVA